MAKIQNKKSLFLIGNGFDLNLGLPTSYADFIGSFHFKKLLTEKSQLAKHIQRAHNNTNWVNVELELLREQRIPNPERRNEFIRLKEELTAYLDNILNENIGLLKDNSSSPAYRLIQEKFNEGDQLINFNYTNTAYRLISIKIFDQSTIRRSIHHIHGNIYDNNIILGVHEAANIKNRNLYLKKAADQNNNNIPIYDLLQKCDEILTFGLSFGLTDHDYYVDFFNKSIDKDLRKPMTIYHYDSASYDQIIHEIDVITKGRLAYFRRVFTPKFIACI